jgi:uncharacterized membrane protein HdeD (DUF308 family)
MSTSPPWKIAIIGMVAIIAGVAMLLVDWSLDALVAFVAMFFVARGALHLVTMSFSGVAGALSALRGGGEVGVGIVLLVWPAPTLLVLVVVVGTWVVVCGVVAATIVLATRADRTHWLSQFVVAVGEAALGATLIARPGGTVAGVAITLGVLGVLKGLVDISVAITQARGQRLSGPSAPLGAAAATP